MHQVTARYDGCTVISVLDLLIIRRKGVDIETERVQKIRQLLRLIEVESFSESEFISYLEQPLDDLKRCETLSWIFEGCHDFGFKS
jgi:hypothetical protein